VRYDPKYRVGDRMGYNNERKWVVEIVEVDDQFGEYRYRIVKAPDWAQGQVGKLDWNTIKVLETYYTLMSPEERITGDDCQCDSWILLHQGCICGYAKKNGKTWGLAAKGAKK
jgi:hypothetical protein